MPGAAQANRWWPGVARVYRINRKRAGNELANIVRCPKIGVVEDLHRVSVGAEEWLTIYRLWEGNYGLETGHRLALVDETFAIEEDKYRSVWRRPRSVGDKRPRKDRDLQEFPRSGMTDVKGNRQRCEGGKIRKGRGLVEGPVVWADQFRRMRIIRIRVKRLCLRVRRDGSKESVNN